MAELYETKRNIQSKKKMMVKTPLAKEEQTLAMEKTQRRRSHHKSYRD